MAAIRTGSGRAPAAARKASPSTQALRERCQAVRRGAPPKALALSSSTPIGSSEGGKRGVCWWRVSVVVVGVRAEGVPRLQACACLEGGETGMLLAALQLLACLSLTCAAQRVSRGFSPLQAPHAGSELHKRRRAQGIGHQSNGAGMNSPRHFCRSLETGERTLRHGETCTCCPCCCRGTPQPQGPQTTHRN